MRTVSRRSWTRGRGLGRGAQRPSDVCRRWKRGRDCAWLCFVDLSRRTRTRIDDRKIADDFRIERAMNLDGGSSSAFWFKDGAAPFSISEQKTVRDFVGVVPK